jgi:hypothetical protein
LNAYEALTQLLENEPDLILYPGYPSAFMFDRSTNRCVGTVTGSGIGLLLRRKRLPYQRLRDHDDLRRWAVRVLAGIQNGRCYSCHRRSRWTFTPNGDGFFIDHDHATGMVRGLACASCNAKL